MSFRIQFNSAKARENLRKHNVRLTEAENVLYDITAITIEDYDHEEQRWVSLGDDGSGRILVVVYTYRDPNFIRLISARKAKPHEVNKYRGA
jgi:uncharacterized DUF497 family protein